MAKEKSVTKYFEQRIEEWLKSEMVKDELFKKTVESKSEKTVEGACNYVLSIAKQTRQVGWDDSEVYGLVRHYYDEDDIKDPGDQNPSRIVVSGHVDLSEEEKVEAMEAAKRQYYRELKDKEAEKEKERKAKLMERKAQAETMQQDLFGGF